MRIRALANVAMVAFVSAIPAPAASIPPAPLPPGPFDDPSVGTRFRAWQAAYEQTCLEASDMLSDVRTVTRTARAAGSGVTDAERQAAHRFALAESQCLDSVRDLLVLQKAVKDTGSTHDFDVLQEVLVNKLMFVYGTEPNALEVLEAISR